MQPAPYGSWKSDLSAEQLAAATVRFGQIAVAGGSVFASEGRPAEGGRNVIVECDASGCCHDVNPAPFDARNRVHEYGGGAFAASADGEVFFSHDADRRIYRMRRGEPPRPVTRGGALRYADAVHDAARDRLIAVREDHSGPGEAVNAIVAIALASGTETVLASGHDFFSSPRLSPDGRRLAWLSWDHPRMPWQGSDLWLASLDAAGRPAPPRQVAGGDAESIFQPEWSPAGELHFASDRSGWWNLYRERSGRLEPLQPMAAEFGEPQWQFTLSMYGFEADGGIVCLYEQGGRSHLARIDAGGAFVAIETPYCSLRDLQVGAGFAVCFAASEREAEALVRFDLASASFTVLRRASDTVFDAASVSIAEPIEFPTEGGRTAHAFFYAPRNAGFAGVPGTKPPLLVISHGGPTGVSHPALGPKLQYWTQRGFAVVDVNYGGSSGYGRAYRERLDGSWGVVDVDDVVNAARFLVARGDVDPARLAIRGGSAGGFTTLAALAFRDTFRAGASHYGISDLETLARDTHKFESRYLDSLVGPYPARADLYRERSPAHFADRLSSALILFQGAEDAAVPPSQAEAMFAAVRAKGLPVAYLLFEGEQHGFRQAKNIRRALEAELAFYGRVFDFVPADPIEPLQIENLPTPA